MAVREYGGGKGIRSPFQRSRIASLVLAAILVLAAALRLPVLKYPYEHIDEEIGVTVARHVVAGATLDTNWDHVPTETWWTTPQFNFSAYNLAAAVVLGIAGVGEAPDPVDAKRLLRWFSAVLGVAAVVLTVAIGCRMFEEGFGEMFLVWRGLRAADVETRARDEAGVVAGHARPAHIGPHIISGAAHRLIHRPHQRGAAVTDAAHAAMPRRHQRGRDTGDGGVAFQGESRPARRIGAAGAAAPAVKSLNRFHGS
jgi:hypothetical protein